MLSTTRSPAIRRWRLMCLAASLPLATLAGCRAYEARPLDLRAHRASFDARALDTAPVDAFLERLNDAPRPDRFDPADGLTLAEAEPLAMLYNGDLRRARAAAGVALARLETAGLWDDPVFGFNGADILSAAIPFEFGLTANLTIPVSGRLAVERARAGAAHEAALRRVIENEWDTRAALRRAWGAWSVADERLRLLDEVIERVERIEQIAGRLERVGELTRVEARLIRAERVRLNAQRADAGLAEVRARMAVLGLAGLPPEARVRLVPTLPDPPETNADAASPTDRLIAHNAHLASRRAAYRQVEQTLRLAIREQYPDLTLGTGWGQEEGEDRLLLGLSLPIPVLNANRPAIAEAEAQREAARIGAQTAFENLTRELAVAVATRDAVRAQRASFEELLVPMLDEQAAEIDRLAGLGEVDTLLLLETVTRRYAARSGLLDLCLAEANARIEIERLLGPGDAIAPAPVNPTDPTTTGRGAAQEDSE